MTGVLAPPPPALSYAVRMNDSTGPLVDRASRGEADAIETLLRENLPRLEVFVRLRSGKLIRSRESSSDIVQSVCREVLESMGRMEYRGAAQFRGWLFTAAARKIADRAQYYQAEMRTPAREVSGEPDQENGEVRAAFARIATPSQILGEREGIERIERAFATLSEEKREVILLARVAGMTSAEIAERTGETDVAIRSRLRRALAELAMALDRPA